MAYLVNTEKLTGLRVLAGPKKKKVGKVRRFVFHPAAKRVVGFLIKRPDAALMFHRKDVFVALGGFDISDKAIIVHDDPDASGAKAIKDLGVNWDDCVIWVGMPIMTISGEALGYVGDVTFDLETGAVHAIEDNVGLANDTIIGKRIIPSKMIKGFKRGQGQALVSVGESGEVDDTEELGAILVDDAARSLETQGGAAEVAGKATAVAADKVKKASSEASKAAKRAHEDMETKVRPKMNEAVDEASRKMDKGAYAAGKHLKSATHMFSDFKSEFDKALAGEEDEAAEASTTKKVVKKASDEQSAKPVAKKTVSKVATKNAASAKETQAAAERSKTIRKVAKKAGPAEDVVIAAGEQLNKMPGMFAEFAEEFNKGLNGEDDK